MSKRVQVILEEEEAARFKSEARKESKSLSSWLRDAGRMAVEAKRQKRDLATITALRKFFQDCNKKERGSEPDWEEHKRLILEGFRSGAQ